MIPLIAATEIVAIIRDIAIVLLIGAMFFVILITTLVTLLIYRKLSSLVSSIQKTAKDAGDISTTISEKIVKPLAARSVLALGAGQILAFLLGISRRKRGGKKNGE